MTQLERDLIAEAMDNLKTYKPLIDSANTRYVQFPISVNHLVIYLCEYNKKTGEMSITYDIETSKGLETRTIDFSTLTVV
jgi:hypothetical protein